MLSAAAYDSLPPLTIAESHPACPPSEPHCHPTRFQAAASSANSWIILRGESAKRIQLWRASPADSLFRPLGREGAGPGEYRSVATVSVDSAGAVAAFDLLRRTLVRYAADGSPAPSEVVALPNGFIHADLTSRGLEVLATDPRRRSGDSAGVTLYLLEGGAFRRTAELPLKDRVFGLEDLRPIPDAFGAYPIWARLPDGSILHSAAATHRVDRYDSDGRLTLRFGADVEARAITDDDVQRVVLERVRGVADAQMQNAIRARLKVTPSGRHPAITRVVALANGEVWVRESPRAEGDSVSWVVYADGGAEARGRVMLGLDDDVKVSRGSAVLLFRAEGADGEATLLWVRLAAGPVQP